MNIRWVIAAALACVIGTAVAEDTQLTTFDKQQFATYDAQVKADLQGTRYKEIAPEDQETVKKTLARMEARWQRADANGKLNVNDTVEMANDQEIVSNILHRAAADSRMICTRETPMGTLISKNVCRSVAQMRREQNDSQESLRQEQMQPQQRMSGH